MQKAGRVLNRLDAEKPGHWQGNLSVSGLLVYYVSADTGGRGSVGLRCRDGYERGTMVISPPEEPGSEPCGL